MIRPAIIALFWIHVAGVGVLAQAPFLTLGKHDVHPTRIIARYANGAAVQASRPTLASLGLRVAKQYATTPGLVVIDDDPGAGRVALQGANPPVPALALLARINALRDSGHFIYVQPSYVYRASLAPTDSRFVDGTLWGLRNIGNAGGTRGIDIDAERAWDLSTGSTNVIVAVIDSGIRSTHRELARQLWRNPREIAGNNRDDDGNGYIDDLHGIDAFDGVGPPDDNNDHGTHVAGTIGAAANDGNGHVGVAWNVQIMACKFLGRDGFGFSEGAIECIDYAVSNGARILNNSWGGGPFELALFDAITSARRQGVLFVAAAGNEDSNNDALPAYPASYRIDNILSVAAIDRFGGLASFSNFGRSTVHLGAPGVDIYSSVAGSDNAYSTFSGTSMAAPHVSGAAALILGLYPDALLPEIRERLLLTTVPTASLRNRTITGGRLNAYQALAASADGVLEVSVEPAAESELLSGRTVPLFITVSDLRPVTNATVTAMRAGSAATINFRNDGQAPDRVANDSIYTANITVPAAADAMTLSLNVTAPGKTNHAASLNYVVIRRPDNDDLTGAFEVPPEGGFVFGSNKASTRQTGEPAHARIASAIASVWWKWTPAVNGPVIIDPAGSAFDSVLAVYTGDALSRLREVASADDIGVAGQKSPRRNGYVQFTAQAGTTYQIAVAGYTDADLGAIRMRVMPGGQPDIVPPTVLITNLVDGIVITNALDNRLVVVGTAADPNPDASGVKEVLVRMNNEFARGAVGVTNWASTNLLRIGRNTVRVIASDFAGNSFAADPIVVTYRPLLSPNDDFASATELTGDTGQVTGNTSQATKESGEPLHAGVTGGKSVWWSYRPARDGVLTLTTSNATFDTVLAVYTGETISALTALRSNDNATPGVSTSRVRQPVRGGAVYFIAVDGVDRAFGTFDLRHGFAPAAVVGLEISATAGGSTSGSPGLYERGESITVRATPDVFFVFAGWEGTVNSSANPLTVTLNENTVLTARFRPFEFTDGFETGNFQKLGWINTNASPWIVQTASVRAGQFAARSGGITHGQRSALRLVIVTRAGTGSFAFRVSSEPAFDTLQFFVGATRLGSWSGEVPWTTFTFPVAAGTNSFEWRYSKDLVGGSAGADAAWLDNLELPLTVTIDETTPARLALERSSTGWTLVTGGQADQIYVLQSSEDLRVWSPFATNTALSGVIRLEIPTLLPRRFFRAIVP